MFEPFFRSKYLPPIWKLAHVEPVYKSGNSSLTKNYRPISLTCVLSKTMESITKDQISDYLFTKGLLSRHQHGFLPGKSTCTQLLESVQDWALSLRCGNPVDVIYIDFSRAFDSIVPSKLMAKLTAYGIPGIGYEFHGWIEEFLTGRWQKVMVEHHFSKPSSVLSGIPQGSVLGPLLFIVFIDDITDFLPKPISAKLFADDLKLFSDISAKTDISMALETIKRWSELWQLNINESKSSFLRLGKFPLDPDQNIVYAIAGNPCSKGKVLLIWG